MEKKPVRGSEAESGQQAKTAMGVHRGSRKLAGGRPGDLEGIKDELSRIVQDP